MISGIDTPESNMKGMGSLMVKRVGTKARNAMLCVGLLALSVGASRETLAAPVGSGTLYVECATGSTCCARYDFASTTYDVFGTPVDMGVGVGTASATDIQILDFNGTAGGFTGTMQSAVPGVFGADLAGSFVCTSGDCGVGLISFVNDVTNLTGSYTLPTGVTYTSDGSTTLTGSLAAPTVAGCPPLGVVQTFSGIFGMNAFQNLLTPTGGNVTVGTDTTFFDSATGNQVTVSIDATFTDVSVAGDTVVKAFSNGSGIVSGNFAAQVNGLCAVDGSTSCCADTDCPTGACDGCYRAAYIDVTTGASVSGPIEICSDYPDGNDDGIVDGTSVDETLLRFMHEESGVFVDRTSSADPIANRICAQVSSLSFFIVAVAAPSTCGNDVVDAGETCDPPSSTPTTPPGNANPCRADCTYCGDGTPNGSEACDDGNNIDSDPCRNDCTLNPALAISGKKLLLKTGKLILLSKDMGIGIAGSDPVNGADSSVSFDDGSGPVTFALPKSGWNANGSATSFKYKNASAPNGPSPVKIAKVKSGLLKLVAKGLPFAVPNGAATIDVVLNLDGGAKTHCMTFIGSGDGNKFLVKDAIPGTCP